MRGGWNVGTGHSERRTANGAPLVRRCAAPWPSGRAVERQTLHTATWNGAVEAPTASRLLPKSFLVHQILCPASPLEQRRSHDIYNCHGAFASCTIHTSRLGPGSLVGALSPPRGNGPELIGAIHARKDPVAPASAAYLHSASVGRITQPTTYETRPARSNLRNSSPNIN